MTTNPDRHDIPARNESSAQQVRWAGIGVLVVGLLTAAWVYWHAGVTVADAVADAAAAQTTAREMQQVERLGGKATVMTVKLHQGLVSLFQGRALAGTLALLAIIVAWVCFRVAGLMAEDAGAGSERTGRP